jgi:hypothetical protein
MQQQFAGPRWVGTNQIRCWRLPANACAPRGIEYCQGAAIRVRGLGRPLPLRCRLGRGFLEGQTHVQYRSGDICDCQYVTFTVCDRETRRAASPTVQVKKWPDLRNGHGPLELSFRPQQRFNHGRYQAVLGAREGMRAIGCRDKGSRGKTSPSRYGRSLDRTCVT